MNFVEPNDIALSSVLDMVRDKENHEYIRSLFKSEYLTEKDEKRLSDSLHRCNAPYSFSKVDFLFSDLEKITAIDAEKLHSAIMELPSKITLPTYNKNRAGIVKYAKTHEDFNRELNKQCNLLYIKRLISDLKSIWNIDISDDECSVLYSIVGTINLDIDILSYIPIFDQTNDFHKLFLNVAIKYNRLDIFEKLFNESENLTTTDILISHFDDKCLMQKSNDDDIDLLIPSDKEKDVFLYSLQEKLFAQENPSLSILQAYFPLLNGSKNKGNYRLFPEFEEIYLEKVSVLPVSQFMPLSSFENCNYYGTNDNDIRMFTNYCKCITEKNITAEEVVVLAKFWFMLMHDFVSEFPFEDYPVLDGIIKSYLDISFLTKILNIPRECSNQEELTIDIDWQAHCVALYLLNSNTTQKGIVKKVLQKIWKLQKISIPDIVFQLSKELINKSENLLKNDSYYFFYSCYLYANSDIEECKFFCDRANNELYVEPVRFHLDEINWRKEHINSDDFFDSIPYELLAIPIYEETKTFGNIVQYLFVKSDTTFAARSEIINKIVDISRNVNRLNQHTSSNLEYLDDKKQADFFDALYKNAIDEMETACLELFTFLKVVNAFPVESENYFLTHLETKEWLQNRSSKLLNSYRQKQPREWEPAYDCLITSAIFISRSSLWKAVKPLLSMFRNSKKVLLKNNLSSDHRLVTDIMNFFHTKDIQSLEQLRKDMANDFVNYLDSSAEVKRFAENYTELERQEEGFNLEFIEPSVLYRYAYVRALYNLGAKGSGNGHFFTKKLGYIREKERSEKVRQQIDKTISTLDKLRDILSDNAHIRHLYEAFWWIRQAHLLSLGVEIDAEASKTLRIQEGKWGYKYGF